MCRGRLTATPTFILSYNAAARLTLTVRCHSHHNVRPTLFIFPVLLLATTLSCDKGTDPTAPVPVPDDVAAFIHSQQFPKAQKPSVFVHVPERSTVGFTVQYGEPHDCFAGCFYSIAFGLRRSNKIGWIRIEDFDGNDISRFMTYQLDSTDSYFYAQEFWDKLEASHSWFYRYALLPVFAKDSNTPVEVLTRLAQSLHTYIYEYLGWLLLEHPKVLSSRDILTIIATIPPVQNEGYDRLRAKAQEFLTRLGG